MTQALVQLQTAVALREHYVAAATSYDDDPRATEYRRLSGQKRDLPPLQFDRALQLSYQVYQRNPLASRIIGTLVDFCFGDEFGVKLTVMKRMEETADVDTERPDAQQIWDDFYEDPVNNLEHDLKLFGQDFLINGELLLPTTVNEANGHVRLGYFDPMNVKPEKGIELDPANVRQVRRVTLVAPDSAEEHTFEVIRYDSNPESETYNHMIGDLFYFRLNRFVNQSRGFGHLVKLLDWLDALDQFFFDALEGFRQRNAFMWDVTAKGATDQEIKQMQKDLRPPRPGSARIHNDKVEWNILTPDLKAQEVERALIAVEGFILGADGFPLHWFGHGSETNLATAEAMSIPTNRMLKAVQRSMKRIVKEIAYYVIDQAIQKGSLKLADDEYVDCQVNMFDFERKDSAVVGAGMTAVVSSLSLATQQGWMSNDTAKKIVDGLVGRLGVETDPNETVEQIREKNKAAEDEDVYKDRPFPGKKGEKSEEDEEK